jgi:hypothetical protein
MTEKKTLQKAACTLCGAELLFSQLLRDHLEWDHGIFADKTKLRNYFEIGDEKLRD